MVAGRPTLFTEEIGDKICAMVMAGVPLVRICEEDWAPHPTTIYRWFREHDKFCYNYARAKEDQADYFVEDIVQIADLATPDNVQVARLRVDTRKWAASKYKPKKYGDKLLTDLQNLDKDGNPVDPPKMVIEVVKL
jgi:hypothetical protein